MNTPESSLTSLGRLVRVHGFSPVTRRNIFVMLGIIVFFMFGAVGLSVFAYMDDAAHGKAAADGLGGAAMCIGITWLLGILLIFTIGGVWFRTRNVRVAVYENGLALGDGRGGAQAVPWEEIAAMWRFVHRRGQIAEYGLETASGQKYPLHPTLDGLREIAAAMLNGAGPLLLRRFMAQVQAGQTLNFGELAFDRAGLRLSGKTLAWAEIEGLKVEGGYISYLAQGKWQSFGFLSPFTPNFPLWVRLAERFTKVQGQIAW